MAEVALWLQALGCVAGLAVLGWLASVPLRDASLVDRLWSLLVATAVVVYAWPLPPRGERAWVAFVLLCAWALRLAVFITVRNWGHGEDRRYQAIRARNQPHFAFRSLYLVFGLQAVLASIVALPLMPALRSGAGWNALDTLAALVVSGGLAWETLADWQLARFRADPRNHGAVCDRGLWRYSRHPNYFGECCVWWGFWLFAVAAGGAWTVLSPLLMTVMLLRVSGVSLLEQDIGERRPAYAGYIARTNAFLPWRPRP